MPSLNGARILVTRDEEPGGKLCALLRARGAEPVLRSTTEVVPLLDVEARARLSRDAAESDWLVLTSPRAVGFLAEAGFFDGPAPAGLRVAVAGSRTAVAVRAIGWPVHLVPDPAGAGPLLAALLDRTGTSPDARTSRGAVLFPASARAGEVLSEGLARAGFRVRRVDLYTPRSARQEPEGWETVLARGLDALTFTSPSGVQGLLEGLVEDPRGVRIVRELRSLPAAVQGPTTAAAVRGAGWRRVEEATPRTFDGLVAALERLLQDQAARPEPPAERMNS